MKAPQIGRAFHRPTAVVSPGLVELVGARCLFNQLNGSVGRWDAASISWLHWRRECTNDTVDHDTNVMLHWRGR